MKWSEIYNHYPGRLILVEAIKVVSKKPHATIEEMAVVEQYDSPTSAWEGFSRIPYVSSMSFISANKKLK